MLHLNFHWAFENYSKLLKLKLTAGFISERSHRINIQYYINLKKLSYNQSERFQLKLG